MEKKIGDEIRYLLPGSQSVKTGIVLNILSPTTSVKIYEILPREIHLQPDGTQLVKIYRTQQEIQTIYQ